MKSLIVTPTYNERENIEILLGQVRQAVPDIHVLVVDDNSPDGTGDYVREHSNGAGWLHLIEREGKMGLGTAYCAGFQWALEHNYDVVVQMDADLSHDPAELPALLQAVEDNDLVIGSRYIEGVRVVNWPLLRLILSWSANIYAKVITGVKVSDMTGGFKVWRREVLADLDIESIRSEGYAFQIETTYRAYNRGYRIKEFPIIFTDRVAGESKMSKNIIWEAVWIVIRLKLGHMRRSFSSWRAGRSGSDSPS